MSSETQKSKYSVQVLEVLSGDDLILLVDLGVDGLFKKVRARLHGVDTPDAFREPPESEAGKVRNTVRSMVYGRDCTVELHSDRKSGWIVTMYVGGRGNEDLCLNDHLVNLGYVYKSRLAKNE